MTTELPTTVRVGAHLVGMTNDEIPNDERTNSEYRTNFSPEFNAVGAWRLLGLRSAWGVSVFGLHRQWQRRRIELVESGIGPRPLRGGNSRQLGIDLLAFIE